MTGAGRTLKASTHAGAVLENVAPYRIGAHQHVPEITQLLGFPVSFTPHLLPVRRGLIATCNVRSTGADLRALLEEAYAGSAVVTVLPEGMAPELARVQHSDRAEIGIFDDGFTDRTVVICAEDNLGKGAAGQAIQNVNRALGLADRGVAASGGARLAMSVTAARVRRERRRRGDQAVRQARRRGRSLRPGFGRCRGLDDQSRAGGSGDGLEAASRVAAAPGRADQRGRRERGDRCAG